jgi:hypothetical protein
MMYNARPLQLILKKRLIMVLESLEYVCPLNRLCGLVVRVPDCRSRDLGFDSRRYQIFWVAVDLKRGPLSLVRINEELLERKVAASVYKTEINGRGGSGALTTRHPSLSIKVGTKIRPPVSVAQSVYFACGLKATEFVCLCVSILIIENRWIIVMKNKFLYT